MTISISPYTTILTETKCDIMLKSIAGRHTHKKKHTYKKGRKSVYNKMCDSVMQFVKNQCQILSRYLPKIIQKITFH